MDLIYAFDPDLKLLKDKADAEESSETLFCIKLVNELLSKINTYYEGKEGHKYLKFLEDDIKNYRFRLSQIRLETKHKINKNSEEYYLEDIIAHFEKIKMLILHKESYLSEAYRYCRKPAKLGDLQGMWLLGWRYHKGDGVKENIEEAIYWWKQAAIRGHEEALKKFSIEVYLLPPDEAIALKALKAFNDIEKFLTPLNARQIKNIFENEKLDNYYLKNMEYEFNQCISKLNRIKKAYTILNVITIENEIESESRYVRDLLEFIKKSKKIIMDRLIFPNKKE